MGEQQDRREELRREMGADEIDLPQGSDKIMRPPHPDRDHGYFWTGKK